jgi:predicted nucleotidyltransferase
MISLPDKPLPYGEIATPELIRAIAARIAEAFNPDKILLFGSYASGKPGPDSDIDMLIVMESTLPRHECSRNIRRLFKPQPCPMDILAYTPEEIRYWNGTVKHIITEAFETGTVIYERKAA